MTHAIPPPVSRAGIIAELVRVYSWNRAAELVQSWLAYERDVSLRVYEVKAKAERERAIEEVAQCCDAIAEQARPHHDPIGTARLCAASARSLKVVP